MENVKHVLRRYLVLQVPLAVDFPGHVMAVVVMLAPNTVLHGSSRRCVHDKRHKTGALLVLKETYLFLFVFLVFVSFLLL